MGYEIMAKPTRRPQAPKRRNFVAKHEKEFARSGAGAHRDRSKYDRIEDYWRDELNDYLADYDEEDDSQHREEFKAKLKGEDYDPDLRKEWEDWLDRQASGPSLDDLGLPGVDDLETWDDYDYGKYDDYDY